MGRSGYGVCVCGAEGWEVEGVMVEVMEEVSKKIGGGRGLIDGRLPPPTTYLRFLHRYRLISSEAHSIPLLLT